MGGPSPRTLATVGVGLIAMIAGGCGADENPTGEPVESSAPSASQSTKAMTEPQPVPSAGPLAGYTEDEVDAYQDAAAIWRRAITMSGELAVRGKADPTARRQLLELYAPGPFEDTWTELRQIDDADIEINGTVRVLWTKPQRILVSDTDGSIDMQSCVDPSRARTSGGSDGKPNRIDVTADLDDAGGWKITDLDDVGDCSTGEDA